jgi:lysyl-tRNA synthetase, class II
VTVVDQHPAPSQLVAESDVGSEVSAYRFETDHHAADLRAEHSDLTAGERRAAVVRCAGRLMLIRRHGGVTFAVLRDRTGTIQLMLERSVLGEGRYHAATALDRGDWVGVVGSVLRTDRGELSIGATDVRLLGKASSSLPDKDKALTDIEVRSRQRYLDLVMNDRARETFRIRRAVLTEIRTHLADRGFWEVEGPMLQNIQGGATARPFITHHNALDMDLYLRIALELHLKRLVVGGMERVFEIGRVFRNEGIDVRHNPEFTMLEAYQAFADYTDMMDLVEGMVLAAARAALGDNLVVTVGGKPLDLSGPWPRVAMADLIEQRLGVRLDPTMPVDEARVILDSLGVPWRADWGSGKLMKQVVDELIQHDIREPVFCIDYPQEVSPLARAHRSKPGYVERFELMVAGFELCNAYSEQNDPVVQLSAFVDEARAKAEGDPEAGDIDLDYVRALEYGMPCTGGLGIGIDRLVMLLAGVDNIREVILFPTMRPEDGHAAIPAPATSTGIGRLAADTPLTVAAPKTAAIEPAAPVASMIRPKSGGRARRILGGFAALGGALMLLPMLPIVHSRIPHLVDPIGPVWFRVGGHLLTMLIGLGLLFLAGQLTRGKQRAWQLNVVLFGAGVITNLAKGPHPIAAVYCAAMVTALLCNQSLFVGKSDPPSLRRLTRLVPIYVGVVISFGFISLLLERDNLSQHLTFTGGLQTVGQGVIGIDGPYQYHREFFREFFPAALLTLGVVGVVGLAYLLFRPMIARQPQSDADWEHANRLVHDYGSDTLAYFALRDDKRFFFASDGEAFVAYTYLSGYALVSGDPIGRHASLDLVLDEFLAYCAEHSWRTAFLAARSSELPRYASRGLHGFYLGDEAIVECDRFSLEGPEMKSVRAAVRRVDRTYDFRIMRESDATPELVEQLNAISRQWRGDAPERGFTMSLSTDVEGGGKNSEFLLCIAFDATGVPGGFLRIVPAYGEDFGYTLDLMRHLPTAPNGTTEFLISHTAIALHQQGIRRLSMNFAMWGRLFDTAVDMSATQRLAKHAVQLLNPFFQVKSLYDFNAKFSPAWISRSLVYQEPADLPRVGLLYAGAEGFLPSAGIGTAFTPKPVGRVSLQQTNLEG